MHYLKKKHFPLKKKKKGHLYFVYKKYLELVSLDFPRISEIFLGSTELPKDA